MEDREPDGELSVFEIRIDGRELIRRAERLVDDGAKRKRGDVSALDTLRTPQRAIGARFRLVAVDAERADEHELLDRTRDWITGIKSQFQSSPLEDTPAVEPEPFGFKLL